MMLSETFQLKKEIKFSNYKKLSKIILKEIANGSVRSVHMSPKEAKKAINLVDQLNCHDEIGKGMEHEHQKLYKEDDNPFSESPF